MPINLTGTNKKAGSIVYHRRHRIAILPLICLITAFFFIL